MNTIVAACQFGPDLYIFTSNGDVYRMQKDFVTGDIQFIKFASIFPT